MGELAALSAAAVWATASIIFTKLGRQQISPLALNLLKCSLALALMILTLLALEGRGFPTAMSDWELGALGVSGIIGLTIGDTAYFHALIRLGPRRTLLLATLGPPATAVLAWPFLGEPITGLMVFGMGLTMAGVVWVIRERQPAVDAQTPASMSKEELVGLGFGVLSVLCQATGNVLSKFGGSALEPLEMSIVRLAFGVALLVVVVGTKRAFLDVLKPLKSPRQAGWLALATLLGTYLGIWLLMAGLKRTSHAGIAATLSSTSPIFILPLAAIFLDDRPTLRAVLGALIAVSGVAVFFVD
ncbi:MAG: DMT family transporter [Myxococcota bacterium]